MDNKRQQMVQEILEICEYEGYEDETEILEVIDQSLLGLPQYISVKEKGRIRKEIFHSLRRLDILSDLLQEEDINDIMVNGYQNIFIERSGVVVKYEGSFFSKQKLEDIVQMMVSQHNRIVNESNPIVDVR